MKLGNKLEQTHRSVQKNQTFNVAAGLTKYLLDIPVNITIKHLYLLLLTKRKPLDGPLWIRCKLI